VIEDVDASLAALIQAAIPADEAAVDFRAPVREWAAALTVTCVNLFLHDVVEEIDGRGGDWTDVRDQAGRVAARRPPLRRYRLSYLISAWSPAEDGVRLHPDEHRLLGRVLRLIAETDAIPSATLQGSLADEAAVVGLALAEPSAQRVRPYELWTALGLPPRACLELVVTAPLRPDVTSEVEAPVDSISLSMGRTDHRSETPDGSGGAIGTGRPGDVASGGAPERRWTAFRIRETGDGRPAGPAS
jgi:hypothetical protein